MAQPTGENFSAPQFVNTSVINPHDLSEGLLLEAQLTQREAAEALPEYHVDFVGMRSLKDPETTESGARIYQELAEFVDFTGKSVVREVTIGKPNPHLPANNISPHALVSGDSWITGPHGLNRYKLKRGLELGFPSVAIHHASTHSPIRKDKSISRAAHQDHVLLDHLSATGSLDTSKVIRLGFSRDAMIGEKFIAVAHQHNREVPYSDIEAPCFAKDMSRAEKIMTLVRQLPSEGIGLLNVARSVIWRAVVENDPEIINEYMGTFNPHPKNIIQESMWVTALINSKVGKYVAATPVDMQGVRTFYTGDLMSQQETFQNLYAKRPNIRVLSEYGPHVYGATIEYIDKKFERILNLMTWMQLNGMSLDGFKVDDILQQPEPIPAMRRHRHLGLLV